jgi:hypothetical protein
MMDEAPPLEARCEQTRLKERGPASCGLQRVLLDTDERVELWG